MKRLGFLVWLLMAAALAGGLAPEPGWTTDNDRFRIQRERLVRDIEADVQETSERIGRKALAPMVMEAMRLVQRHEFVPEAQRPYAYENRPLPIGYGQTISQPYIVAIMTELADAAPGKTALEVGTGSGYQAAILAACGTQVFTMEIIPELAQEAKLRLERLGYQNVEVRTGDGYYGWPEHAPFDVILVTAAGSHIPPPLVAQLKPKGKMVIPVGGPFMTQQLMLVEKTEDGKVTTRQLLPVAFVPLTGGH
jgi:protein-L-isoaspartate(D-aspartate) O-methyltransferase